MPCHATICSRYLYVFPKMLLKNFALKYNLTCSFVIGDIIMNDTMLGIDSKDPKNSLGLFGFCCRSV